MSGDRSRRVAEWVAYGLLIAVMISFTVMVVTDVRTARRHAQEFTQMCEQMQGRALHYRGPDLCVSSDGRIVLVTTS